MRGVVAQHEEEVHTAASQLRRNARRPIDTGARVPRPKHGRTSSLVIARAAGRESKRRQDLLRMIRLATGEAESVGGRTEETRPGEPDACPGQASAQTTPAS